ncbi:MAG: B12-binding domain-containing radical SAM protein, partial [Promethearchaeota archaeon]
MKVLLINPDSGSGIGLDLFLKGPPLALMSLAGGIPEQDVEIIDLKVKSMPVNKIRKKIASSDVVGITSYTPSIARALNLARIVKNVDRGIPVVLGGYHASLLPEETVANREVDIVVRGEGEFTFKELIDHFETVLGSNKDFRDGLKDIKGIAYKKNGIVKMTEARPLVKNLDDLPFPRRDLLKKYKYKYFGSPLDALETARGCPFDCSFCCVRPHWSHCWRTKSPERVLKEIAILRKDARWYAFQDSEFSANMKRCERIFNLIHEYGYDNIGKWYSFQGRVDDICRHPEIVEKMADYGLRMVFIGVESVYQKSLNRIGKRIKLSQIKKAVRILHDLGISIFGSIIIGNLDETWDEVIKSGLFASQLNLDIVQFTPLTPLPGSRLYYEAKEKGWIVDQGYKTGHYSKWNLVDPVM